MLFLALKQNSRKNEESKMKKVPVMLSLGSNLGEKTLNITRAIELLSKGKIIENIVISSYYESEPLGYSNQPNFINAIVIGETTLSAENLLKECKKIEQNLGRQFRPRWHEREIDIDIILYSDKIIHTEELQIPHPELMKRKFVLIPANEIAGNWKVPPTSNTIAELLENCPDKTRVKICVGE